MNETFTIGRDPACDITLADDSVSRLHANLTVLGDGRPYLTDRGSANGIRITRRGVRSALDGPVWLDEIERIEFGDVAIEIDDFNEMIRAAREARAGRGEAPQPEAKPFAQPRQPGEVKPPPMRGVLDADDDPRAPAHDAGHGGLLEFVPVVAGFARLRERKLLVPSIGFALLIILLMTAQTNNDSLGFLNMVGVGVCFGSLLLIYRMCGKHRSWLAIGAVMLAEAIILKGLSAPFFFVFRELTGAGSLMHSTNLVATFIGQFVGAGLMEELMKMTPVFIIIACTSQLARSRLRTWIAAEPLDVILYVCAAATMFVLIETLQLYVPGRIDDTFKETVANTGSRQLGALRAVIEGSQLAIVRTLNGVAGHLAYSGYFGYYVGLGLLRPRQRTRLWIGGYLGAAALHGASNTITGTGSLGLMLVVKLVTVSFLVTAILNARKISPTRAENFATVAIPSPNRVRAPSP